MEKLKTQRAILLRIYLFVDLLAQISTAALRQGQIGVIYQPACAQNLRVIARFF
jgi:hypothetical protein